jgi:cation:H+ antiporter
VTAASGLLLAVGLVLLVLGAEALVRGASRLAAALGIAPLIIGLTVVAFGTSAPEVAVSIGAAASGRGDIALGNVIGSNIFNILLILGVSAAVAPLVVSTQLVRLDVPIMVGVSAIVLLLALDGRISRLDGVLLLAGIGAYTGYLIRAARRGQQPPVAAEDELPEPGRLPGNLALILAGLVLLVLGSRWLVDGAADIAAALGVSELVIGLTIVAAGTSLPEIATSITATLRGQRDIAVGNVVGSNIFNLLLVLGAAGLVAPHGVAVPDGVLGFDLPVMLAVAVACLPIFLTGYRIRRREGFLFLGYYVAYTVYLVLTAVHHPSLPVYSGVMLAFVLPLTVLTLGVSLWREARTRRG